MCTKNTYNVLLAAFLIFCRCSYILEMIALPTAYPGTESRIPIKPAIFPAANRTVMIVKGWIFNVFPMMLGVIKFASVCCAINVIKETHITIIGSWKTAINRAGINAIHGPINGMIFMKKANVANKSAKFNPIIEYPINNNVAKIVLIKIWARMYKLNRSLMCFIVFVTHVFASPEKNFVTNGTNFS